MPQRIYAQRTHKSSENSEAYRAEQQAAEQQAAEVRAREAALHADTERVLEDIDIVLAESLGSIAVQAA